MTEAKKRLYKFLVEMGRLTPEEYYSITNDKEFLQELVKKETLTKEEYSQITGETYAQ